jgi:hypothetical protein
MGRVVLIAYYFPPLVGIASERAEALSRHLQGFGWDPVVVTVRDGHYHRALEAERPAVPVVRTRSVELSRLFRSGYAAAVNGGQAVEETTVHALETGRAGAAARRVARAFLYVPDAQVGWIPFAASAARRALAAAGGDGVVFSTSVPYSAHFAAMSVARRRRVPWVAELRDPWSTSRSPGRTQSRLRRQLDRRLERRVVARADHIVVTSEGSREELLETAGGLDRDRISVVRNGFEPTPEGRPPPADEPMTILYAGTVAPGEDMGPVLEALDRVHARHTDAFRLRVLGPTGAWGSAPDRPWLSLEGTVTPSDARQAMGDSSVLLLVQMHEAYRTIIPGKCFEYIGVRRPVLALVPHGSEMEALLLKHADVRLVNAGRAGQLESTVEGLLTEHRRGQLQAPRVPTSITAPLARREQAKQLAQIFEQVSARGARD